MNVVKSQVKLYTYNYKTNIETSVSETCFTATNIVANTVHFINNLEIPEIVQTDRYYLESWNKGINAALKSLSNLDEFFYCKMSTEYNKTEGFRLAQNKNNWYYTLELTLERI